MTGKACPFTMAVSKKVSAPTDGSGVPGMTGGWFGVVQKASTAGSGSLQFASW